MKYKKYLLFLLTIMIIGVNRTYADSGIQTCENETDCFYASSDNKTFLCYNPNKNRATISYSQERSTEKDAIVNKNRDEPDGDTGITVPKIGNSCPQYLVYRYEKHAHFLGKFPSEGIWGFSDSSLANKFVSTSNEITNMTAYLAVKTTKSNYDKKLTEVFSGGIGSTEIDIDYTTNVTCDELFDASIKKIINDILGYVRIIVPILVITLGTLDFAKAVMASKEDEMKKAQKTFIKRVVIGVAFFFTPAIVNVLMDLANLAWQGLGYTSCSI